MGIRQLCVVGPHAHFFEKFSGETRQIQRVRIQWRAHRNFEPVVTLVKRRHQMKILIVMNEFGIGFKRVNGISCVDTQLKDLLDVDLFNL